MNNIIANYRKIWWAYSALLGGTGALGTFLAHAWIRVFGASLNVGPLISYELLPVFGICVVVAALYLPILFLSDLVSKRSRFVAMISTTSFSIFLATIILLKRKHFELGPELLIRGWNVYLYTLVMGICCLYGWQRSKI